MHHRVRGQQRQTTFDAFPPDPGAVGKYGVGNLGEVDVVISTSREKIPALDRAQQNAERRCL
ncbi:hypothetical protein [Sphingopyxis panaciterrulae]|uniref:Uncharacterized protein n=1 Tax=Sphingopyxis panaciterrulae TaxID=462372 RepID=A0A7W9B8Z3_9SPHN|nr:hypothetical protein [Sphingopyxis panaciterrulae]MBB5708459.1 hypothetical protein [Sphingopyxis panaciterrulae]HEX2813636.1 hypothetical protein [Sphingopyxis sp.]